MNQPTKKVPFDIYLPATAATPAKLVETIEVEVYENFGEEFLTTESSELIERTRARHMGFLHGKDIRDLRKRLNLTQDQLSDLLDCGKKSLSRWESGRGLPSGIVNKLLRLLDEGYLAPASLAAVNGPRLTWTVAEQFQAKRHTNIILCDFVKLGPSATEVGEWLVQSPPEAACL
ncbi:MAG: type II toxin-antitoxin system MqsA family antitoxin [Akkermansiaceae bacterium]|nr:type II toxin-antitoxin system MqsA family antitoxin [Akkermansiaceae bacterium]